jgi:hypothetical protein
MSGRVASPVPQVPSLGCCFGSSLLTLIVRLAPLFFKAFPVAPVTRPFLPLPGELQVSSTPRRHEPNLPHPLSNKTYQQFFLPGLSPGPRKRWILPSAIRGSRPGLTPAATIAEQNSTSTRTTHA